MEEQLETLAVPSSPREAIWQVKKKVGGVCTELASVSLL